MFLFILIAVERTVAFRDVRYEHKWRSAAWKFVLLPVISVSLLLFLSFAHRRKIFVPTLAGNIREEEGIDELDRHLYFSALHTRSLAGLRLREEP